MATMFGFDDVTLLIVSEL